MATRLKITSLKFISAVDAGAQGWVSNVTLVKRAAGDEEFTITAKVSKLDEALGIVYGYALATTVDGGKSPHIDLQGDAIVGGDDLMKIALAFAESGAQSDVMHDETKDGWCPFVMPLNAETKKALQLSGEIEGIAIGMKPSAETFKRFQSGELAAFSIGGTGIRTPIEEQKRAPSGKVAKASLYTDEVDGHAHKICVWDDGGFYVEHATMAGADYSHSHGIVRGEDGTFVILADSGHSHKLAEGQPALVVVEPETIVVVAARDPSATPAAKSTRPDPIRSVKDNSKEPTQMTTPQIVVLSEAQNAHYSKLSTAEQTAFLAKSSLDRDGDVAKALAADTVVFKGEKTGIEVRKSQGDLALQFAKQAEQSAVDLAKANEKIAAQESELEKADVRKAAADALGGVAGDDATHDYIVKSIRKGGGDTATIDKAMQTLKSVKAFTVDAKKAKGAGGEDLPTGASDPVADWNKAVATYAEKNGIKDLGKAEDRFMATPEGAVAKRAYDSAAAAMRKAEGL